jgi:dipeptidyl-peptidase-4
MRLILTLVALLAAGTACAERLTLERLHADPALSGAGVRSLKVSPDGARVTFLRARPDDQFQMDLWEFNMKDKSTRRLVDSKVLVPVENLSDAEKALRERARTAALKGIISYSWSPDGKQLLVPLAGNLYLVAPGGIRQRDRPEDFAKRQIRFLRTQPEPVRDRPGHRQGAPADHRRQGHRA